MIRNEISAGRFVELSDKEDKDLQEFLKLNGYDINNKGLKKFILDNIYESEDENNSEENVLQFIKENPHIINNVGTVAKKIWQYVT